ncbi:HYR domain-containing protein [Flavobacterium sp. IMCC34852]|uniref:HYR domain-containing protein n=1 Tax=Flavobacterium rivulicola TaxID=2732161 RepID=A0A7Y3VYM8_9FLAO|nr:HYR domain-containing protein [Flavobacterium sp. IMCC34852]NNT71702.1 HYR domain-containing protein [Flavobacterium sp. IMCC34852]
MINKSNAQTIIEPGPEHYASKASSSKSSTTPIIKANTNNPEQLNKAFNLSSRSNTNVAQSTAVNCYIPPDATYTNFPGNDDGSVGIALPFQFSLYGTNYNVVFINNNGNLTFTAPSGSFDPVGFPTNIPMVAPFWADVDTRVGNTVKYKISPTSLIVTWPGVGYYNQNISKLNTFQVVITNGNDPLIGLGNNVAFYYGDMQWTTGEASSNGGSGGFGGVPATAGINKGDGINFIQIGRFNQNNTTYGGPLSGTSGISYLDFGCYPLTAGSLTNLQPAVSGVPANNTINIACGETGTINLTALPPEVGQNVSVVVNTGGLCNTTQTTTSGTSSNATVTIAGDACNEGTHNISFVFTDNFNPSASTTVNITVVIGTAPVIACPANITVSNATGQCGANVSFAATATGSLAPTLTYSPASGSFFPVGTTTVTATATNACGTDTCTFTVTVNDTESPVVTCPGNQTLPVGSNCLVSLPDYVTTSAVNLSVRVNSGSAATSCVDGFLGGAPEPHWRVNVNNQGWVTYPSSGICFANTPNIQYNQSYNCSNDYPASVIVCFRVFEDDGVACIVNETCLVEVCQSYPAPTPGTSATYTLSIPSSAPSWGTVSFTITSTGAFTNCPAATDNCSVSVTQSPLPGTPLAPGNHTVTLNATDPSGNTDSCTFNVLVIDTTAPIINCPPNITGVMATSVNGAVVNYPTPLGFDNCSGATTTRIAGLASGSTFPIGTTTVTHQVTNAAGLTAQCSFNVTVVAVPPQITCPSNITVNTAANQCGANVSFAATETIGIPASTITYSPASGSLFPVGTTTVTATATNTVGSSTCTFTVTVNDTQPPTINCPANIVTTNTTGQCGKIVTFEATASDNCGTANLSYSPASGSTFAVGTTTVIATANDGNGNTTSCTFTVTVNDTEAPSITCSAPVTISNTPGLCSGTATLTAPVVTDNCAVAPQMTLNGSFSSGSDQWNQCGNNVEAYGTEAGYGGSNPFNAVAEIDHEPVTLCQNISGFVVGQTYQLTFRASRRSGAPPTVGTIITIDGGALNTTVSRSNGLFSLTPETISFVATQTTHQLKFEPSAGWGGTVGFIIDDISINRQFISNNAPPTFPFGNTTVTWTATDASGNTVSCNQTVTVNDTEAPTIACPANITVNNTANQCGANVSFTATASDNCGTATITYSPASGSFFAVGTTTVTATADDGHGNTTSCTFTVTVNDTQPPVINCPANINVDMDPGSCGAVVTFAATASDNCGTSNITYSPASGSFFALGTTTVTATADDGHGNTTSCTFTVTVDLLDHVNLQWPPNAAICPGGTFTAYGQVYEPNVTTVNGQQGANIEVHFGYNSSNTNPSTWTNWSPASFNQFGGGPNNDEYFYNFSSNVPGTYYYTFRYRQNGCTWQYGGFQQWDGGTWDGTNYVSGVLTVQSLDWANLQWPPNATICQGSSMTAYGQVYESGVTPGAGLQGAGIEVQFGYSSTNTNPSGWSNWSTASFNQFGGGYANDEYFYNFTPPTSGTYYYTFRYRLNGCLWQYGGYSSGGGLFWDGTNFVNGTLNVSPTTVGGVVSGGTSICPGETSALLTLSNYTGMILGWESSTAPFLSWNPIGNNNNTYTSGPLAETTKFRAIVQSGVCPSMASAETTVVVYLTYPFYADNDDDGYGAGPSVLLCSDDANNAPEGYSVDGTDCDDTLADRHETFPFFVDADGDGYGAEGSTAVQLCAVDGDTPPESNYSVNDDDCNDLVFEINPSVAEIPFDNIDNNCNGTLYDGHPLIVVNVLSPSCGGINHGLNNTINCTEIDLGEGFVIGYRFKVTNLSTGQVDYVDTVQHHFKLTDTDIYAYGTSYSIQVAAIVNGEVQGYNGNTCTLTTTNVATTKVVNSQCGSTLLFMNSTINANAVNSAITYRFRVARADAPSTYYYTGERNLPNFNLTMLTAPVGFLTYDTEYKVDVQIKIKLANVIAWSQYGQVCSIFTPAPPTSSVIASQCELVASSYTQVINATPFAGATLYRFLLTHYDEFGDLDYEQYQDSPTPNFTLSMFSGLLPDTTYNVAVSMLLYGTFVPYDKECTVTTPMAARIIETTPFKATVYPNPYTNNFMIDVTTADTALIEIKVYDMVGRLVEQKTVKVSDLEKAPIGERYPSGVYNVIVSQGENIQTVRVVRR